jgi:hypothetical protein
VDLPQKSNRRGDDVESRFADLAIDRLAVLQDIDVRRCRCDAFGNDPAAQQRVDEGALAGVELADDDEEKQLVQLLDGPRERLLMFGGGGEPVLRFQGSKVPRFQGS